MRSHHIAYGSGITERRALEFSPVNADFPGTTGDDRLIGTNDADTMSGLEGDDVLDALAGDDVVDGGDGDDTLYGGSGFDTLVGGEGLDQLWGGSGDDFLDGGAYGDNLYGGTGSDTATYRSSAAGLTLTYVNPNTFIANAQEGADYVSDIETVVGTEFNDDLTMQGKSWLSCKGLGGDDILSSGDGDQQLLGGSGADVLYGNRGDDVLDGGGGSDQLTIYLDGDDTILGKGGADLIEIFSGAVGDFKMIDGGAGQDSLRLRDALTIDMRTGQLTTLTYTGQFYSIEKISANGSTAVLIHGDDKANTIGAGSGANEVFGEGGDDVVSGIGQGVYSGGDGNDTVTARGTLQGDAGDDVLKGSFATDHFFGGTGSYIFVFTKDVNSDVIHDIELLDTIDLSIITTNAPGGAFTIVTNITGAGQMTITYDSTNDRTVLSLNYTGTTAIDGTIYLSGNHLDFDNYIL